jgi:ferritin
LLQVNKNFKKFLKGEIMISKEMTKALNLQIMKEIFSAYLYQSMAAYAASHNLKGFTHWFEVQALEELFHAEKFYNYILDQGETIELHGLDKPKAVFKSPLDLFEETLAHEKTVTASINSIVEIAKKENDNASFIFLQWFVTEQVEEEATPQEIIGRLKMAGQEGSALFMIDAELGARAYTPPVGKRNYKLFLA